MYSGYLSLMEISKSEFTLPCSSHQFEQYNKSKEYSGGCRHFAVPEICVTIRKVEKNRKSTYILLANRFSRSKKSAKSIESQDQDQTLGPRHLNLISYLISLLTRLRHIHWHPIRYADGGYHPKDALGRKTRGN